MTLPFRPLLLLTLTIGAAQAGEPPARPRLCREDLPEGVRLPQQAGCTGSPRAPATRQPGVYDLGDGTTVRIGGRTSAEYGVRH